jgi:hypothetical protein
MSHDQGEANVAGKRLAKENDIGGNSSSEEEVDVTSDKGDSNPESDNGNLRSSNGNPGSNNGNPGEEEDRRDEQPTRMDVNMVFMNPV